MADLGKNGFGYTGYTEPFIVPTGITMTASQISTQDYGITGITGAVPIEYTIDKNAGLYVRSNEIKTGTSFKSKDVNFDTRMEFNKERYVVDFDGTPATISLIEYDNVSGEYTITTNQSVTTEAGKTYKVVAKLVDVGTVSATVAYTEGQKVVEPYPHIS